MRVTELTFVYALTTILACSGCGGGAGGAGTCSASPVTMSMGCTDYGEGFTTSEAMQDCAAHSGSYSSIACPSENRVGRCIVTGLISGTAHSETQNYYTPNTTAGVMQTCTRQGGNGTTATYVDN